MAQPKIALMFSSKKSAFKLLKNVPLFAPLDSGTLATISGLFEQRVFKADQVVFQQGDPGDAFYVVVEGAIKITVTNEESSLTVALLGPGDHLGEMALFDNFPRSARAEATSPTTVLAISRNQFVEVLRNHKELPLKLLQTLATRLREANAELVRGSHHSLYRRLTRKLLHLTLRHGKEEPGGVRVKLPISGDLMAEMLGAESKPVELILGLLESEGVISMEKDHFWLHKVEPLLDGEL